MNLFPDSIEKYVIDTRDTFTRVLIFFLFISFCALAMSQDFYSYKEKNGTRVFTNIPPSFETESEMQIESLEITIQNEPTVAVKIGPIPSAYDGIIRKYADYYQIDPLLIHSIIATESDFNPKAISRKGARGLMQLMPATAESLGVEDIFDPDQNIYGGVRYLRSLLDMFNNDVNLSLAAYNAGENIVRRLGRIPAYEETIDYVQSVTRRYKEGRDYLKDHGSMDASRTFRYTDSAGVLHLTNIPPHQ